MELLQMLAAFCRRCKMIEKRKSSRVFTHDPVGCRIDNKNQEGDFIVGVLHDLTKSGACMHFLDRVQVGDKITIRFNMPSFQEKAVVRWVKDTQDDIIVAGIKFV